MCRRHLYARKARGLWGYAWQPCLEKAALGGLLLCLSLEFTGCSDHNPETENTPPYSRRAYSDHQPSIQPGDFVPEHY